MSKNTTDTNQASEDELERKVDTITLAGWRYGRQKEEVLELIRTEKLKLLAEVGERAIPNPTTPAGDNEFVPLDEIDKLGAEL